MAFFWGGIYRSSIISFQQPEATKPELLRRLAKKGFSYEIWKSQSTGNTKRELSKSLEALGLFSNESEYRVVRIERGEPVVEMKLSKLLDLTKTKP